MYKVNEKTKIGRKIKNFLDNSIYKGKINNFNFLTNPNEQRGENNIFIYPDNRLENLKLSNPKDHAKGHVGSRNNNGTFVCKSKEFQEKKFRLYDSDRNLMRVFTLNELISKTYRRGNFEYRGEFTGLSDKNGKEIYEGDLFITENYCKEDYYEDGILNSKEYYKENPTEEIIFHNSSWMYREVTSSNSILLLSDKIEDVEIIGNIHENPELLNA